MDGWRRAAWLQVGRKKTPGRTDAILITAIAPAHQWFQQLATGQVCNIAEIASREGIDRSYAARIINGQPPVYLNIEKLTKRMALSIDWL